MDKQRIDIRRATVEDASAIATLSGQLGYPGSPEEIANRLESILRLNEHVVFVAVADRITVGWIHVCVEIRVESDRFAEIGGLVVADDHRREGIGQLLLSKAEEWTISQEVGRLRVRTRIDRESAALFYRGMGFTNTKTQKVFDKTIQKIKA